MTRALLTLLLLLCLASRAAAAPTYATVTGTVRDNDGSACSLCDVTVRTVSTQAIGGETFPQEPYGTTYTTDASGDLPAGVFVARSLIVGITVAHDPNEIRVRIPDQSTVDIADLITPPVAPPVGCTGCIVAANIAAGAVTPAKLGALNSPTDEYCYTYEATGQTGEWQVCGGGGGGSSNSFETWDTPSGTDIVADSATDTVQFLATGIVTITGGGAADTVTIGATEVGDVSAIGDCTTGACFTGTSGNSLQFEGSTSDGFETTLTATDPTADRTITLPNRSGAVALERWFDVRDYGAACDGSTNDATFIQAAIDAAHAVPGGTVYIPPATCNYGSTLTLYSGIAIAGSEATERVGYLTAAPHELSYTGTGTAIDVQSRSGVRLSGVLLRATSASFAGPLIDADGAHYLYLDRVVATAAGQSGAATCALLSINDTTDIDVANSSFSGCGYAIYGRVLSSNYANVIRLSQNAFYRAEVCSVQNPGEAWEVTNNKWQQQGPTDNMSNMFCHGSGICAKGMSFTGNMSVDQPSGPTVVEFDFCGSGIDISGNNIAGNSTQDGIGFSEPCDGCSIAGNWFGFLDEAIRYAGTGASSIGQGLLSNSYSSVTNVVNTSRPKRSLMQEASGLYINDPDSIFLNVDADANSSSGALVVGSNNSSSSATQQYVFYEGSRAELRLGNDLRLYETDDSNYVQVSAPTLSADWTLTLPTDDGSSGQFLQTNGSGVTTWATPSGSGNVSNTGTPADNQVAVWADATTIEGTSGLTFSSGTLTATTFSGALSGNATTATALASNPSDCASDTYATTIAASGNLTCASVTNASTTGTAVNTPSTLVLRDGSGNFAAGTITAALTGNSSTATALAANPADCGADTYATTIAASGALTCSTVTNAGLAGSIAMSKTLLTADAGVALSTNSLTTASDEQNFLKSGALTCGASTNGKMQVHTTPLQYCDNAATPTLQYAAYGSSTGVATSATALATNPTDCAADTYATTIDASGNLTCTTVTNAGLASNAVTSGKVQDGTIAANDMTEGFISSYAGTGLTTDTTTSPDSLKVASTITTTVTGSASLNTLLAGRTGTTNDTTISSDNNGTIYGSGTTAKNLVLRSNSVNTTTGQISLDAPYIDLYPSMAASTSSNFTLMEFDNTATLSAASGQSLNGVKIAPALTISGSVPLVHGFWFGGTITNTDTSDPIPVYQINGFLNAPTLTSATANSGALYQDAFVDQTVMEYTGTGTIDTTSNPWAPISFLSNPKLKTTGTGDVTIGAVYGLHFKPGWYTSNASSSGNVDNLEAVNAIPPATAVGESVSAAGSTITNYSVAHGYFNASLPSNLTITNAYGLKLTDWDKATNNYTLYSNSAASMYHGGKVDVGDTVGNVTGGATKTVIDIAPSANVTDTSSTLVGVSVAPTTTMNPTTLATANALRGFSFAPAVTLNSTGILGSPSMAALYAGGTVTTGDTKTIGFGNLLYNATTYTTSVAGASPISTTTAVYNAPAHTVTSASGTSAIAGAAGLQHLPTFTLNSGGAATASMTVTDDDALVARSTYTKTAGTALTVTTRRGLRFREAVTSGSPTITTQVGVDIENLSAATNNVGIRNADTTVYPPCVDDISGNTDYMVAKSQCTAINLTAGGARDFTVGTDQIADGYDGQIIYLFFTGSNSVKFDDADNVNLSAAGAMTMSAGDTLTLLFSATRGEWLELGRADN